MIWESCYWKTELCKHAKSLIYRSMKQKRWIEASFAKVEQDAMVGCFIVRRLLEAYKVSSRLIYSKVSLHGYQFNGKRLADLQNWHRFNEHYDLESHQEVILPLREVCNQMIHSFVFIPILDHEKNKLDRLFFSSDRKRGALLYEIDTMQLAEIFIEVSESYQDAMSGWRKGNGQWELHVCEHGPE